MARALDGAIAELAPKTLGLLTTLQLDSLGCTRQMRRTLVARRVLVPLGGGVFRHGAHPRSWHQDALAAVLVAGPGGVASHLTAAVLWAFDEIAPGPIEVTVPRARAPRRVPATVHRVDLGPADIDRLPGLIPRTSASRSDKHGGGIARVDLWWDEARLVAEVEGHRTHSSRRHRQADHERAARLGLTEHRVIGFTYEDVRERPDHVVSIIRAYLDAV